MALLISQIFYIPIEIQLLLFLSFVYYKLLNFIPYPEGTLAFYGMKTILYVRSVILVINVLNFIEICLVFWKCCTYKATDGRMKIKNNFCIFFWPLLSRITKYSRIVIFTKYMIFTVSYIVNSFLTIIVLFQFNLWCVLVYTLGFHLLLCIYSYVY